MDNVDDLYQRGWAVGYKQGRYDAEAQQNTALQLEREINTKLQERVKELEKLAYIGDHFFHDSTYKFRHDEMCRTFTKLRTQKPVGTVFCEQGNFNFVPTKDLPIEDGDYWVFTNQVLFPSNGSVAKCPHGVRHPHPCRECEDQPLTPEQLAEVDKWVQDNKKTESNQEGPCKHPDKEIQANMNRAVEIAKTYTFSPFYVNPKETP